MERKRLFVVLGAVLLALPDCHTAHCSEIDCHCWSKSHGVQTHYIRWRYPAKDFPPSDRPTVIPFFV
jgi:hypothetical protein